MYRLSEDACRSANRISLGMIYANSTVQPDKIGSLIDEAIAEVSSLLNRIDPVELKNWIEQFNSVFDQRGDELGAKQSRWPVFLKAQCDLMHHIGFHQKTIAVLGSALASWDHQPTTFDKFASSLDQLFSLTTSPETKFRNWLIEDTQSKWENGITPREWNNSLLADAACGIAICLVEIDRAVEKEDARDLDCAAMAMFGAGLTTSKVNQLSQSIRSAR